MLLSAAGASLLLATIAGAVGSHALTFADAQALRSFETAVQFQFFHGLGIIAIRSVKDNITLSASSRSCSSGSRAAGGA